ncbi:MAG TPA: iron ABC transporter permease [Planctomycetota bacterium]|nr:iron ABC transporter permease [Planctomycetota bacterium]
MFRGRRLFVTLALAAVAAFFLAFLVYPLFYVLKGSVVKDGAWTLEHFRTALDYWYFRGAVVNSLLLGVTVTLLTTAIALPLAAATVRYDFPLKRMVGVLVLLPLVLPPFVGAIGIKQMFAHSGAVNAFLSRVTWVLSEVGILDAPVDVAIEWTRGGFWMVAALTTLHLYPIMYLNVAASLASVDRSCEEAAENLGASRWNVFRRVTFPLMLPGYFAGASIVFIWAFTDLGTPLVLNYPQVIPRQIYDKLNETSSYPLVVMVLVVTALMFVSARWFVRGRLHARMSRGAVRATPKKASRRGTFFILLFVFGVTFIAVLPHIAVVLSAVAAPGSWQGTVLPTEFTLDNFVEIGTHRTALPSILNSLFYSALATAGAVVIGLVIAWLLTRERFFGQAVLDTTVMMPLAIPGIALAFGYVMSFRDGPLNPMRNPVPLLVISYIVRRLPYMVRSAVAGFQHVSRSLEEASTNLGAGGLTTLRRITIPLVAANLLAGAILTFIFSMFEVSQSLVLAQDPRFFPIAGALNRLGGRFSDGPWLACAMGVAGMVVLGTGLIVVGRFMGRRLGEVFRA